jgi:hypothetical protein
MQSNKIKELNNRLEDIKSNKNEIETELQLAWNEVFDDLSSIKDIVSKLESSNEYSLNGYGEINQWVSFYGIGDFKDCMSYFENYMMDNHFVNVDWENDVLSSSQGESLIIQDDTKRDNGVWLNGKLVICGNEYKDDGEVNETVRNELIEQYMEKTGYYPGVFRVDSHGNVFPVSTLKS